MLSRANAFWFLCLAALTALPLWACSGSSSTLPGQAADRTAAGLARHPLAIGSVTGDVVAIHAGGAAAGGFAADVDFNPSSWTHATSATIDTSGITIPAPQAVYQTEREGTTISYSIPGLVAGAAYTVKLSFTEIYFTAAGKRVFNIAVQNSSIANFDIFATAGTRYKAVSQTFATTSSANGTITIALTAVTNYAAIDAIEIAPSGATPTPTAAPTAPPSGSVWLNAGGAAAGFYAADADFVHAGTWTESTTKTIATSGVSAPAPQAVYADQRLGQTISYTIGGLTAGGSYTVRLDFAEFTFSSPGQRVFNAFINAKQVLTNFDIIATAGAPENAVAESFTATANSSGAIAVALDAVTNYAAINAISVTPSAASPTPAPTSFNDYTTYGYDNQRNVFNPSSLAITPTSVANVHLAWQSALGDYNTQSQPVLATEIPGHAGVLFTDGGSGKVYASDALTGTKIWATNLGQETSVGCNGTNSTLGIAGTVAYDPASKSLYVVANTNTVLNGYPDNELVRLDGATGAVLGHVDLAPPQAAVGESAFAHTAVTLQNGVAYAGIGSNCDTPPWRGTVVSVDVPAMTIAGRFFTLWDPQNTRGGGAQPWSGGSIWGWGGVTIDFAGNVLTGVGNGDVGFNSTIWPPPFVAMPDEWAGLAETLLELNPGLSGVVASHHPIPVSAYSALASDLDVQGSPLVFQPTGTACPPMVALQAKSGTLFVYNEANIGAGPAAQYAMEAPAYYDTYFAGPAYSPATGLLYADVDSSVSPSLFAPGLVAINPGCGKPSVAWHAAFGIDSSSAGIPRAVPAVSAGGVIFAGTANGSGGEVWEINAATGTILNGGTPVLQTSSTLRMPPTIDGEWVFVLDNNGNLYGLTIDPNYPAIAARHVASAPTRRWSEPH